MPQLRITERKTIEAMLNSGESFGAIGRALGKSETTISREARKHRKPSDYIGVGRIRNRCLYRKSCGKYQLCINKPDCTRKCSSCNKCSSLCPDFKEEACVLLESPPYVCNGCKSLRACPLRKFLYSAKDAEKEYEKTLSESRSGFNLCEDELVSIDAAVSPLVLNGQSLYHITTYMGNEIPCSARTLYRLVASGSISAKNIDMPRVCRMRPRKKKKCEFKVDKSCRVGRSIDDFRRFMAENPGLGVVQMDSVIGKRGGKLLLTLHITQFDFMLAFIRDRNTASSVAGIFKSLFSILPLETYKGLFPVLLTDNGSEFSDPRSLEFPNGADEQVSHVFYCDPNAPFQKPNVELNHELIRRIVPKGTSMDDLTQADINRMMSHINSYARAKFGGKSPAELLVKAFGLKVLRLLGQEIVKPQKIILSPKLFLK